MEKYNDVRNINRWGSKKPKEPIKSVKDVVDTKYVNMSPRY